MIEIIYSIFIGLCVVVALAIVALLGVPFYWLAYRLIRGKWPKRRKHNDIFID